MFPLGVPHWPPGPALILRESSLTVSWEAPGTPPRPAAAGPLSLGHRTPMTCTAAGTLPLLPRLPTASLSPRRPSPPLSSLAGLSVDPVTLPGSHPAPLSSSLTPTHPPTSAPPAPTAPPFLSLSPTPSFVNQTPVRAYGQASQRHACGLSPPGRCTPPHGPQSPGVQPRPALSQLP